MSVQLRYRRPLSHRVSHRGGLLLAGFAGVVALRIAAGGKLGRVWSAFTAPGFPGLTPGSRSLTVAGTPSSSSGSSGGSSNNPSDTGGYNFPGGVANPFGLTGVTSSHLAPAQYWQGPNAPDRALIPDAIGEWNYQLPAGAQEPVKLPGSGPWTLKQVVPSQRVGGEEVWTQGSGPTQKVIAFLHLALGSLGLSAGVQRQGGQTVATSAWPLDPRYGNGVAGPSNAHLAVIYNQAAAPLVVGGWQ